MIKPLYNLNSYHDSHKSQVKLTLKVNRYALRRAIKHAEKRYEITSILLVSEMLKRPSKWESIARSGGWCEDIITEIRDILEYRDRVGV